MEAPSTASKRRVSPLIIAGLLVFAGLASLIAQIFILPGKSTDDDWQRASAYVIEQTAANDAIRVHPSWTEAPMPYLQPVGNQLHRQHHPLAEDIQGIERIWIVSETNHLKDALKRLPFEATPEKSQSFDTVTAVLVDVPKSTQFPYILNEHLEQAKVTRLNKKNNKTEECTNWDRNLRKWYCGGNRDRTLHVGDVVQELGDDPHHCIWAHALPHSNVLRVEFPAVPLQDTLRIRAGIERVGSSRHGATPTDYRIFLDDKLVVSEQIPKHDSTWPAHDIQTVQQSGKTGNLRIEVESENDRGRHFCFNGWVF